MSKVLVAIPSKTAQIHANLVQNLIPQLKDHPFLIVKGVSPIAHARNIIVEQFLKTDATHLWMIDDDTVPPTDALEKMLALDLPIVTGVTPMLQGTRVSSNIYRDTSGTPMGMEDIAKEKKPFSIQGSGASCILIKREMFEKLTVPYYTERWASDGQFITEDIAFGNDALEAGYQITCIPTVVCKHARTILI